MKKSVLTVILAAATVFLTNIAYANEPTEAYRKDNTAEQKDTSQTFTSYTSIVNEESKDLKKQVSYRRNNQRSSNNQSRQNSDSLLILEYYTQGSDAIEKCYDYGKYCKKAQRIENILASKCAQGSRNACTAMRNLIALRGMKNAQMLLEY